MITLTAIVLLIGAGWLVRRLWNAGVKAATKVAAMESGPATAFPAPRAP